MNKLVQYAYQFIRLFFLHHFEHQIDMPVLNHTFIMDVFRTLGSKSTLGRKAKNQDFLDELQLFSQNYFIPTFSNYERISLYKRTQACDLAATQMLTAYKNNVFMNFFKRSSGKWHGVVIYKVSGVIRNW